MVESTGAEDGKKLKIRGGLDEEDYSSFGCGSCSSGR